MKVMERARGGRSDTRRASAVEGCERRVTARVRRAQRILLVPLPRWSRYGTPLAGPAAINASPPTAWTIEGHENVRSVRKAVKTLLWPDCPAGRR